MLGREVVSIHFFGCQLFDALQVKLPVVLNVAHLKGEVDFRLFHQRLMEEA